MVANVIDNAIVHNEQDGWIVVTAAAAARSRGRRGRGRRAWENGGLELVQREQVAQLAQPFRRLGADRTGSDGGSGLGLSIVAAIAAAHGGELVQPRRPGPAGGHHAARRPAGRQPARRPGRVALAGCTA